MTTILEALKEDGSNLRVEGGNNRWLYYDEIKLEFVVMYHKYRSKGSVETYRGSNEEEAMNHLLDNGDW